MKVLITNLNARNPFSTDVVSSSGRMIRLLVPPLETLEYVDIDPYYLNQDKMLRNEVFRDAQLSVSFAAESDDLIGLPYGSFSGQLASARVGTTGANLSLSGLATLDGIAIGAGDRILVKDQTNKAENGVYVASVSTWSRALDLTQTAQAVPNLTIWTSEGAANEDKGWVLTTDAPIILGTTGLTWEKYADTAIIAAGAAVERRLTATGDPRVFTTPENFTHTTGADAIAPSVSIDVFHNGVRQMQTLTRNPGDGSYYVEEGGGAGMGFDTVHFLAFTPKSTSELRVKYQVAP